MVVFCKARLAIGLLLCGRHERTAGHDEREPGRCHDGCRVVDVVPILPLNPTTMS